MEYVKVMIKCHVENGNDAVVDYDALGMDVPEGKFEFREGVLFLDKIEGLIPSSDGKRTIIYTLSGSYLIDCTTQEFLLLKKFML